MRSGFPDPRGVFVQTSTPKPIYRRRRSFPLFGYITNNRKLGIDPWRAQSLEASLLYELGLPRCKGKVSEDREDGFFSNCRVQKASFIFPSSYHLCHDGPTHLESHEQARCYREDGSMGCRWVHYDRSRPRGSILDGICGWVVSCRCWGCRCDPSLSRKRLPQIRGPLQFSATNNEAEYKAVLTILRVAKP